MIPDVHANLKRHILEDAEALPTPDRVHLLLGIVRGTEGFENTHCLHLVAMDGEGSFSTITAAHCPNHPDLADGGVVEVESFRSPEAHPDRRSLALAFAAGVASVMLVLFFAWLARGIW